MPRLVTYLLCAAIVATLAGGLGGSFQPARLIVAASALLALTIPSGSVKLAPVARQALTMSGAMILGGALSLFWTLDLLGGLGLLLAVSVGALSLYVVTRTDLSENGVRILMWAWVAAVGMSLPIALYEVTTGSHFQFAFDERMIRGLGEFPFASIFFGNYNDYSAWLCLGFSISMSAFLEAKGVRLKTLITLVNIAIVLVIFINTSRGAILYAAILSSVFLIKYKKVRAYALTIGIVTLPVLLLRFGAQISEIFRLASFRFEYVGYGEESFDQRAELITAAVRGMAESYGFGIGVGSFEEYVGTGYYTLIPNPHNIITEIGVNFGVIPLILFIATIVRLFLTGLSRRDLPEGFRMSIMCGTLGIPIIGVVPSQAIGYIYWWVWLATLIAMASARGSASEEKQGSALPNYRNALPQDSAA